VDKSWPPEIDIMEVIGRQPSTLYTTVHFGKVAHGHGTDTHLDLSADFHEYAVDWGPNSIDWYFDRKLVFSEPTSSELHKPCYILANLAVGKPAGWGGAPDGTTKLPSTMKIASIRAWQRLDYLGASVK
jgi:beta-glucanase (GH16 family)